LILAEKLRPSFRGGRIGGGRRRGLLQHREGEAV
jgi:hypothetical protein